MNREERLPFRPRARLLLLLGNELIRDSDIAVFELVKNAYDADASTVRVLMRDLIDSSRAFVSVLDDGSGMDWDTVTNVWLEPGTDFRLLQRQSGASARTRKFRRLPLGEKGVGRFAVHKLGDQISLITRARGQQEIVVDIDWTVFSESRYLSEANVSLKERTPEVFTGNRTGTLIEITKLRDIWTRGMVRDVRRAITSICSPFDEPGNFRPELALEPDYGWVEGLMDPNQVLEYALFHAKGSVTGSDLSYDYDFTPFPGMTRVQGRQKHVEVQLTRAARGNKGAVIDLSEYEIGTVKFELHVFDREPQILSLGVTDKKGLRDFLDENGGVRVYRDGIRVYDYGESGDDWLNLSGLRINVPSARLSNNIVIGAVSLSLAESTALVEKTNREGFVESPAFIEFREAVQAIVRQVTNERNIDKAQIRKGYRSPSKPFTDAISSLRAALEQRGVLDDVEPELKKLEQDVNEVQERLLTAAGAGLSLAMVIHEVEKGISELNLAVDRNADIERIKQLAKHLSELVDGLTYLTRRSGQTVENASTLVRQALFNTEFRLSYHGIASTNGFLGGVDFQIRCTRRLVIATLMNLIDNAIYWLDVRGGNDKKLYVGPDTSLRGGPAIVVADNGPGFIDDPEALVEPFISRRPDGMGLGLHLANEVMKVHRGRLEFPQPGDVELPPGFDGAVIAMVFAES